MCDPKLFEQMKARQVKIEPVRCTCSTRCWCNQLSFRCTDAQEWEECMSPAEMLETYGSDMNESDKKFLRTLIGRPFISQ